VLAQVDRAGAPGAEALEDAVAAEGEALVLALEELLGLEVGHQAVADEQLGELARRAGQRVLARRVEVGVDAAGVDLLALADDVQEFANRGWCWHG
jgi:hypothetical protein